MIVEKLSWTARWKTANVVDYVGRIYSREVLEQMVDKYLPLVESRKALVEFREKGASVFDATRVDLNNVCGVVTDIYFQGEDVMVTIEAVDTPKGKVFQKLYEGKTIIPKARLIGNEVSTSEKTYVMKEATIIAFDILDSE